MSAYNFRRSRRSRPPSFSLQRSQPEDDALDNALTGLQRKNLHLCKASPLLQFSYNRCAFYSRRLTQSLRNAGVNVDINAAVTFIDDLKLSNSDDASLHICVKSSVNSNQVLYEGWMVSFGRKAAHDTNPWLPVLLWRGALVVQTEVHNFLKAEFSCYIKNMEYSALDLLWITTAVCAKYTEAESDAQVTFTYIYPPRPGDEVDISLNNADIRYIWNASRPAENVEEFSVAWKDKIMDVLYSTIHDTFGIMMEKLQLNKTVACGLTFSSKGMVKMANYEIAVDFLKQVTQLHQEHVATETMDDNENMDE